MPEGKIEVARRTPPPRLDGAGSECLVVQAVLTRAPASWRGTPATAPPPKAGAAPGVYRRHRPEATALYDVVRDHLVMRSINKTTIVDLPRLR